MDYRGAADAAHSAHIFLREFRGLAAEVANVCADTKPFNLATEDRLQVLRRATEKMGERLGEAEAIERSLVLHGQAIAPAYEDVNAPAEILHLLMRLCVTVAESAAAFCGRNIWDSGIKWQHFAYYANMLFSDREIDSGLPTVNEAFTYVEATAIASERLAHRHRPDRIPDGPWPPNKWVLNGKILPSCKNEAAWRMLDYLWKCEGRVCDFEDLALPVRGKEDYDMTGEVVPSFRRGANHYLKQHQIPFHVEVKLVSKDTELGEKRRTVRLTDGPPPEEKAKKPVICP